MDKDKLKKLINKWLKDNNSKTFNILIIVVIIAFLAVLGGNYLKGGKSTNAFYQNDSSQQNKTVVVNSSTLKEEEENLKSELKNLLQQITGVGKVEVMVYCESGEEQVPAYNVNETYNSTNEKSVDGGGRNIVQKNNGNNVVVTQEGGASKALIVKTNRPKITGVCIVAEGAQNKYIELSIIKIVTNLFDIPSSKVAVYPMKK